MCNSSRRESTWGTLQDSSRPIVRPKPTPSWAFSACSVSAWFPEAHIPAGAMKHRPDVRGALKDIPVGKQLMLQAGSRTPNISTRISSSIEQIKGVQISGAWSTHGGYEKWYKYLVGNLNGIDFEHLLVGERILKWISRRWSWTEWTGCNWLRIGTSGGLL
jgi:hypothetical protein